MADRWPKLSGGTSFVPKHQPYSLQKDLDYGEKHCRKVRIALSCSIYLFGGFVEPCQNVEKFRQIAKISFGRLFVQLI